MVDVDRRTAGLAQAHAAALRRLSTRAASSSYSSSSSSSPAILKNSVLQSFRSLAQTILSHLRDSGVTINPGLASSDFDILEAEFSFHFPPDLRAVLSLGIPSAPGFPDWNVSSPAARRRLKALLEVPIAAVSLQIARKGFWSKRWGVKPLDTDRAVQIARKALKRSPLLIPLFDRCYLPSFPCLAGNPVFLVGDWKISIAGSDLMDFFDRRSSLFCSSPELAPHRLLSSRRSVDSFDSSVSTAKTPRWIEFWSDAAVIRRTRNFSSSSSASSSWSSSFSEYSLSPPPPEAYVEIRTPRLPVWVGDYLGFLSKALRDGGWEETDVNEMVHLSATCYDGDSEVDEVMPNKQEVFDALLLSADRLSGKMRIAGWSSDEVSDALSFVDFRLGKQRKAAVQLPPKVVRKFGDLAAANNLTVRPKR